MKSMRGMNGQVEEYERLELDGEFEEYEKAG